MAKTIIIMFFLFSKQMWGGRENYQMRREKTHNGILAIKLLVKARQHETSEVDKQSMRPQVTFSEFRQFLERSGPTDHQADGRTHMDRGRIQKSSRCSRISEF